MSRVANTLVLMAALVAVFAAAATAAKPPPECERYGDKDCTEEPVVDPRGGVTWGDPMGPFEDGAVLYPMGDPYPNTGVSVMFDPIRAEGPSFGVSYECRTNARVVGNLRNQWGDCMEIRHLENLPAGHYTYEVRATDFEGDGEGNVSITVVDFRVAPKPRV
jgi:hypothetical protein